jgi:hypothetical protein
MSIIDEKIRATANLVPADQADRMRVMWNKGRNMFSAFFTEIESVRRQIGNDELFATWCFFQLRIDVATQSDVAVALRRDDAARVRNDLAAAKQAEKDQRAADAHARKMERLRREGEIAAEQARIAGLGQATSEANDAVEKARQRDATKKRREEKAALRGSANARAKQAWLENPTASKAEIAELADCAKFAVEGARRELEAAGLIAPKPRGRPRLSEQPSSDNSPEDTALYDQYVIEGRTMAGHQWTLGDLAIKVSALRVYGEGTLERYARDIGVELTTLQDYRWAAQAWPQNLGRPNFSIARSS